ELIERAFKNKEDRNSWKLSSFYEKVIDSCISGLGNHVLIKELPELVVQTAWREWKPRKIVEDPKHNSISSMIRGNRLVANMIFFLRVFIKRHFTIFFGITLLLD
ncbi:hypothetical protein ACRFGN_26365, partial [Klebsiella pneumoniae]